MVFFDQNKKDASKDDPFPFAFKTSGFGDHKGYECKGPEIKCAYDLVKLSEKVVLSEKKAKDLQETYGHKGAMYIKGWQIANIHKEFQDTKGQPDETKIVEFLKNVSPKIVNAIHDIQVKAIAANDEK
jgi:hypothetical protein